MVAAQNGVALPNIRVELCCQSQVRVDHDFPLELYFTPVIAGTLVRGFSSSNR